MISKLNNICSISISYDKKSSFQLVENTPLLKIYNRAKSTYSESHLRKNDKVFKLII